MDFGQPTAGLALLCDDQGFIQHILYNSVGISEPLLLSHSLTQIVEPGGLSKLLNFMVELRTRGAVFDWELNIKLAERVAAFHFTGVAAGNQWLIMGSHSSHGIKHLYEEMMRINNEQLNALRSAIKEQILARNKPESELYDEFSRLNNELVTLQRELAKKNVQLEKLNAQKNQFLGIASHDLRSPLAAIISFSELLLEETANYLRPQHAEFLSIIHASSEFMLSMVNNLLDVAAIEAGKLETDFQPVELAALIKNNIAVNRVLAANKEIKLEFDNPSDLPIVMVDRHKIEQVLNNLISNAVKFSYPGSRVTVSAVAANGQVRVAVTDEGRGIPEAELEKLFKPFAKTSVRSTGGEKSTGLGLMIARKVIEAHHGQIGVDSVVGQGSTFYFTLPIPEASPPKASHDTVLPKTKSLAARPKLRILLAEDNLVNQKVALRLLAKAGYQADVAPDGQAVGQALQNQPYDLILMDLHMPRMDGLQATRYVRQKWPQNQQPHIIALTASTWPEDIQQCLAAGMNDVINKPIRFEILAQKLRELEESLSRPGQAGEPESENELAIETAGFEKLPVLDEAALAQVRVLLGINADQYMGGVIGAFLDTADKSLATIKTAVERRDTTRLQQIASQLATASNQLGVLRVARLCAQLAEMAHTSRLDWAAATLPLLEQEIEQAKIRLNPEQKISG